MWFNQAYRGTFQLIGQLREGAAADGLSLHVVGTHTTSSTPFLQACDVALRERDELTGDAWVEHALAFCAEHDIEVFVPGRERAAIAGAAESFAHAGVRLMVSPLPALTVLADKGRTHDWAHSRGIPIPRSRVVRSAAQFRAGYDELRALGLEVCMKPLVDHGAHGFRVLSETAGHYDELLSLPGPRIHPDRVEHLMAEQNSVAPWLVSEYLDGEEISIDVLSDDGELLAAVPRSKSGPQWTRLLVDDPVALEIATAVVKDLRLRYLSNVQVRYGAGSCRLLEVNARAASGLYQSIVSGLNLPYAALRLLLDGQVELPPPVLGATVLTYTDARPVELPFVELDAPA